MKLCGQWHEGIEHISNEYLETKSEYQIEDSVGVVTRCLNVKQLQEDVERYQQRISNSGNENKRLVDCQKKFAKRNRVTEKEFGVDRI